MKRRLAVTAAVLTVGVTLAGCGNSISSSSGESSAPSGGSSGGAGGLGGSSKGTLDVWIMDGTNVDQEKYFQAVNKKFEAEHPGVKVNVQFVPWTAAHDKFTTSVAGGKGPDVAEMGTTWNPEFAEAGALADLTGPMESSGVKDSMVPGSLQSTMYQDKYYGVPWYAGVRAIAYRKDWFDKLGLQPPKTWDDLVKVGNTIKQKMPDVQPFAVAGDYEYELYPFIWGAGGTVAKQEGDRWVGTINQPKAVKGIEFLTGLVTEHQFSPKGAATWNATNVVKNFELGRVAMTPLGQWEIATIYKDKPKLEGKVGTIVFPTPTAGQESQSFLGGSNLVVWNSSDMKQMAWEWTTFMSSEENQLQWANDTRFFPTVKSVVNEPDWASSPEMEAFITQFKQGRNVPSAPQWGAVQGDKVIPNMVQSILTGQASVQEAADQANDEIEAKLNSGG